MCARTHKTQTKRKRISEKNEWKNAFRIKVIKVNFYYMNIEYYILFHHQPLPGQPTTTSSINISFDGAIFVRTIYLNIV